MAQMPMSTTGNKRGFTLLELLVAMVIMTVLCGVAMAAIGPALEQARLRAGACTIISALRYARSEAITRRTDTVVQFDREQQRIAVLRHEQTTDGEETWHPVTTPAGRSRKLPDGLVIADIMRESTYTSDTQDAQNTQGAQDTQEVITFTATGQAENAAIVLHEKRGGQLTILVDAITGQCRLQDNRP